LPKREHDSINHPNLDERKLMFANPEEYWKKRKEVAVNEFVMLLASVITSGNKGDLISIFAKQNMELAKEILKAAKTEINLLSVKPISNSNRDLNPHLRGTYLDTYEIEKFLKICVPKHSCEGQLRLL
jgi:hypothetical protein